MSSDATTAEFDGPRPGTGQLDEATAAMVEAVAATSYLAPLPAVESESPTGAWDAIGDSQLDLSLADVLWQAESRHPELQKLRHEIEMASAQVTAAGVYANPRLVLDTQTELEGDGRTELSSRVEFAIPRPGRRRARIAVASAAVVKARAAYQRQLQLVRREAADAAIEVAYLQELAALEAEMAEVAQALAAELTVDAADEDPERNVVNRIEADVEAVSAQARRLATINQLDVARVALSQAIGLPADEPIRLTEQLAATTAPLPTWLNILAYAQRVDPEIAEAMAALRESRQAHGLAQLEAIPDAVLGPRFDDELGSDDDQVGVRFSGDVPVFDHNEGAICEAAAQIRRDQAGLRAAELNALARLAGVHRELKSLHRQLEHFNSEVRPAIERHEATLSDPTLRGLISVNRRLAIQQDLARLKRQGLEVRRRYGQLQIQLEQLVGRPLATLPATRLPEEIPTPPKFKLRLNQASSAAGKTTSTNSPGRT